MGWLDTGAEVYTSLLQNEVKLIVGKINHDWMDDRHMGDKLIHSTTALNSSSSSSRFE